MPDDKFLLVSLKGRRPGVACVSTPRGEAGAGLKKQGHRNAGRR
jgi:hypothetical protein